VIKARGQSPSGDPVLLLGLSRGNTEALHEGRPIRITAAELVTMGLPGTMDLVLVAGETEELIAANLGVESPSPSAVSASPCSRRDDGGHLLPAVLDAVPAGQRGPLEGPQAADLSRRVARLARRPRRDGRLHVWV
jgi:uncharacterized protein YbjT (DUF2867 family)